jgi:voltage-gated potassium channel
MARWKSHSPLEHSRYRAGYGLRLAPVSTARAVHVERNWRLPTLVAMLATIPAFYIDLLREAPSLLPDLSYLAAAIALLAALWHTAHCTADPGAHWRANWLDLLLVAGLLAAAIAPPSLGSDWALLVRLGVAFLTLVRMVWALQHLVTRGGTIYLIALAVVVLVFCGAGFWLLEPTTPTLTDGLWLAFTTAATVGYGDVVPTTPASKIFAVFVVLLGFGVLTLVTAAIATTWIETEERRIEREILHDLRKQIGSVHADLAALRAEMRSAARLQAESREASQMSKRSSPRGQDRSSTDER